MTNIDTDIIYSIKAGDQQTLAQVYQNHRSEFIHWLIKSYHCQMHEAKDIYQVTVVVFYDNIISGKLTALSSSIKSYLFAIGKNKMREYLRQREKINFQTDSLLFEQLEQEDESSDKMEQEAIFDKIESALKKLGEPCKALLEAFYYYKWSMDLICQKLDYSNENSAKTAKYKCMQRLRREF